MNQQMTDQVRECFSRNLDIIVSEDPTFPTSKVGVVATHYFIKVARTMRDLEWR